MEKVLFNLEHLSTFACVSILFYNKVCERQTTLIWRILRIDVNLIWRYHKLDSDEIVILICYAYVVLTAVTELTNEKAALILN